MDPRRRSRPAPFPGAATAALLVLLVQLAACADDRPVTTTLAALTAAQDDFSGRTVVVSGTLRHFPDPEHYWIENEDLDRVAVEFDGAPVGTPGERVEVNGRFLYDREAGRRILVESARTRP